LLENYRGEKGLPGPQGDTGERGVAGPPGKFTLHFVFVFDFV